METKYSIVKFQKTNNKLLFETESLNDLRKFIEWDFRKKHSEDVVIEKPYIFNHLRFSWTPYWIIQTCWNFVVSPEEADTYLWMSLYKGLDTKIEKSANQVKNDTTSFWL